MSWAKIDDRFAFHAKTLAAGNDAVGAWVRMLSWSAGAGTDGKVPRSVAHAIATKKQIEKLIATRFLDVDVDDYSLHNFLVYNPAVAETDERRAARAEAGRIGGVRSGQSRRLKREVEPPMTPTEAAGKATASDEPKHKADNGEAVANPVPVPVPVPRPVDTLPHGRVSAARTDATGAGSISQSVQTVLAEMQRHASLAAVANAEVAQQLVTAHGDQDIAWLAGAMRRAGEKIPLGQPQSLVMTRLRAFATRASAADLPSVSSVGRAAGRGGGLRQVSAEYVEAEARGERPEWDTARDGLEELLAAKAANAGGAGGGAT